MKVIAHLGADRKTALLRIEAHELSLMVSLFNGVQAMPGDERLTLIKECLSEANNGKHVDFSEHYTIIADSHMSYIDLKEERE